MNNTLNDFNPPWFLRNRHVQSIFASMKFRRPMVRKRAFGLLKRSKEVVLHCNHGVRLQGFFSGHPDGDRDLVILLHGWEGNSDSMYLLSAAGTLFDKGLNVFRLNFRDHGTSHYLNREPFHSCRLEEVLDAIQIIQRDYGNRGKLFLCGFSLGGNFSLRVAANVRQNNIHLHKVVAICPVLHPPDTMDNIEKGLFIYRWYFIQKWKRSLLKKQALFPGHYALDDPEIFRSLLRMTDILVDRYSPYPDSQTYLNSYSVTGEVLKDLRIPVHIIISRDDPVIPYANLAQVAKSENLEITTTRYGGHCGFIQGISMKSWIDDRLVHLFAS
jgi:uncharacterized protein